MSLVTLDQIGVSFGKKVILDGASLSIQPGEKIGLVGPNGSGKTTLLRMLAGEREPDEGDVYFARGVRAGYLPQDILEMPQGTVVESVRAIVGAPDRMAAELAQIEAELAAAETDEARMELAQRLADHHAEMDAFEERFG